MPRFSEALQREAESIKRPPPIPAGNYIFRVTKQPDPPTEITAKTGDKFERYTIPCAVVSAVEVDEDELASFGDVKNQPNRVTFMFSNTDDNAFEGTLNRMKMFCTHCGVNTESGTAGAWLAELPNAQFMGEVTHRMDPNDNETVYAEIKRTAPVE